MKLLFLAALVAGAVFADKDVMIKENRIVAQDAITSVGTTCSECQSLVKRFAEASRDPVKMRELKMLLKVLCHETSYVDECNVFVDNLDNLIKKLEPWLKDAEKVCKSIHLCKNNKLDAFRRIGMLYIKKQIDKAEGLKDLVCDECQLAANEIKALVDDKEKQKEIRDFLSQNICAHAGSYRGMCDMVVDQFLPELFQELDVILRDTKKACADIGFCARHGAPTRLEMLPSHSEHPFLDFWKQAKSVKTSKGGEVLMSCIECKLSCDGLLIELEDQRNEIAKDIQNLACIGLLPKNFTPSCEDFLSMYLPTVLYMTFQQFTGEGICTKMHTCDQASLNSLAAITPFEQKTLALNSCGALQSFVKEHFGDAHFRINAIATTQDVFCGSLPSVLHGLCFRFTESFVPKALNNIAAIAGEGHFCPTQKQ